MASALQSKKLTSEVKVTMYDFDPNSTDATAVGWVDMKDFSTLLVGFFRTVGTSDITLSIKAAPAASATNAQIIVEKTITSQPDAVGDYIFIECLAEQIAAVAESSGYPLRYASAYISFATATDEGVVTYIRSGARVKRENLTEDYIS